MRAHIERERERERERWRERDGGEKIFVSHHLKRDR